MKRRLFIAGVVTILPAAAIVPSMMGDAKSPTLLVVMDEMANSPRVHTTINEHAVQRVAFHDDQAASLIQHPIVDAHVDPPTDAATPIPNESMDDIRHFNGRPIRTVRTITMLVTAYSPDERSCGEFADGITASGYSVWTNGMKLVAADTDVLPFGSLVTVPGYDDGEVVPVLDRGGRIKGNRLDVLYPTHERALKWGAQRLEVIVWEYVDGKPGDFQFERERTQAAR